jgi:hypothetical protein
MTCKTFLTRLQCGRYYAIEFELLEVSGKTVSGTTYLQVLAHVNNVKFILGDADVIRIAFHIIYYVNTASIQRISACVTSGMPI